MKTLLNKIFHAIFWIANITFLLVAWVGIGSKDGAYLIGATLAGREIERQLLTTLISLIAISTMCTVIGLRRLRKQPLQLIRLFYGVEAPLFVLCLLRLYLPYLVGFQLSEFTHANFLLILGTFVVCIVAFYLEVLYGYAERHRAIAWLQMLVHSLMPGIGIFVGVALFYAVPTAAFLGFSSLPYLWRGGLWEMWSNSLWQPVAYLLFVFSCILFVFLPSILASYYIQSGYRILRAFSAQYGKNRTIVGSVTVVAAWAILCSSTLLSEQPQIKAFNLLENPPQTDSARQELLAKSDIIRTGLLNAYLSPYRYIGTTEELNQRRFLHEYAVNLPDPLKRVQGNYNRLMWPISLQFWYEGSRSDSQKAEKLYAEFFDQPIQKAEQPTILNALQSRFNPGEAQAGLLDIDQKNVWLAQQQVTVEPQGDWANVELYEVYKNQTAQLEEVLYYFSLPESAVITGVWLGDTENRANRFPFIVSPRGAAQKIYTQEVRRQVDPALLEQVGPRQYRLRAFPIPAKLAPGQQGSPERPSEMHLWLTYKVMQKQSGWAMPELAEKRNIFWNKDTKRIYNGQVVESAQEDWLPSFLPATGQYQPTLHQVNLPNGYQISAKPLSKQDYLLPQGKKFAVILDSSRSMNHYSTELAETFSWLKIHGFADSQLANNDADLYVTAPAGMKPKRIDDISKFDSAKMTFYGMLQHKQMLRQFVQLRGNTSYDGILLLTDEGNYEFSDDTKLDVPPLSAPLWMVHLGAVTPAYDDDTLKAIQDSGGGVCTELSEVLEQIATKAALGPSAVSVVDGYAWFMEKPVTKAKEAEPPSIPSQVQPANKDNPKSKIQNLKSEGGFEALAARQMVIALSKQIKGDKIAELDAIHAIAKNFQIVTPYSSMIVLVNDGQREALKRAETGEDRFSRKVENDNISVPEPEIIGGLVVGGMFLFAIRKRRTVKVRKQH
ncbi:TIGR02921 family PEP-CTERM protein [Microcoleus sp. FACHB-831]|uniref:TIGR02921 family PEP-CTERM protein n=1 Tax=Microcoleus sp. FACHB-831 TaxID=2692827 RepID=UPI001686E62D|nr:TIGR02921 family PEP-CTERM protein [Microcoleus sp. FACHB-831]MBD1923009.1 TIGR02921 family PEP-CTERM protein [Microcoleus sp. FACHB-831]